MLRTFFYLKTDGAGAGAEVGRSLSPAPSLLLVKRRCSFSLVPSSVAITSGEWFARPWAVFAHDRSLLRVATVLIDAVNNPSLIVIVILDAGVVTVYFAIPHNVSPVKSESF